ncbi:MAG: hypothetical protein Q9M94_07790 [Candidatus Gracilibacteria bacterium]|nr:hypothetical protein [Candidatus Gracilibacteria bacterium]
MFINYLKISEKNIKKEKIVVFYGVSGGGKSTYLDYFMKKYKNNLFLFHKEEKIKYKKTNKAYIFIDEIVYFTQLIIIFRYLFAGKKIFIATHINLIFYKIFFLFFKKKLFNVDKNFNKIKMYLDDKNINASKSSLKYFIKNYSGSFNELDFMLNNYKNKNNFEEILYLFEKECKLIIKNKF